MTLKDDPRPFWDRVLVGDGCWNFTVRLNRQGYGRFCVGSKDVLAHRLAWELWHGEDLPPYPEAVVGHHCDNPSCVRPDHLFVGTQADNIHDAKRKGRMSTPPVALPHDLCRRGHSFAEHGVMRSQGRVCGVCLAAAAERRKHPCELCGAPCSQPSRICMKCYAAQRRRN